MSRCWGPAGRPRQLLDRTIDDETLVLYSTPTLIDELTHTLRYPKFAQRIGLYATTPAALVAQYTAPVVDLPRFRGQRFGLGASPGPDP